MNNFPKAMTTFPKEVGRVSFVAVTRLEEQGYFHHNFENTNDAKELFHYRFSESLLPKFISGEDIEWEEDEFERVFSLASVEHAVHELECEGKVYRFGDMVVLAER
jgi:hypothetical protein